MSSHRLARIAGLAAGLALGAAALPALAQPHGGHGGPMMFGGPPHQMERLLDGVGASAEQKGQIRTIVAAAHADLKAQRQSGRALREQMLAAFTQPTVDARAVESLRQQMLAQHDAASKRMTQAMVDASRVLSADQRARIGQQMAQRRALFERHRAEREALDGAPKR